MDSYQPIFDAVRSRISGGDVGQAIENVLRESFGMAHHVMQGVANEYASAAIEQQRPSAIFRPVLSIDGNQWCALYGDDLQNGVAGFGDNPDKAMRDFDAQWLKPLAAQGDKP
ncbi:hypothetical protein [Acidovorax sp. BL-A-41-H1]|uniref:hypothetical protein n=1 Tax=Acidovorax sp. BL-A-41-H1 TaxID=3421102 RepID=UPI003F7A69F8